MKMKKKRQRKTKVKSEKDDEVGNEEENEREKKKKEEDIEKEKKLQPKNRRRKGKTKPKFTHIFHHIEERYNRLRRKGDDVREKSDGNILKKNTRRTILYKLLGMWTPGYRSLVEGIKARSGSLDSKESGRK